MTRVLVCGGRDFNNPLTLVDTLFKIDKVEGITVVITGGATGADALAETWARATGKQFMVFKADWWKHGKAAGPIRNQQMLDEGRPELVIAFPGGRGTADMVRRARDAGLRVMEIAGR
jgi:predicted Rossmann-fold nucleotide-binding protein